MMRRIPIGLLTVLLVLLGATSASATDLSGSWSGYWVDCNSGHRGPLRATFCKCADGRYNVVFTGRFWKVLPFRYSVVLEVTKQEGDTAYLSGQSNLGLLFGSFSYSAQATATDFVADYCSRRYQGQFVLKRCGP